LVTSRFSNPSVNKRDYSFTRDAVNSGKKNVDNPGKNRVETPGGDEGILFTGRSASSVVGGSSQATSAAGGDYSTVTLNLTLILALLKK
jgi:hypothetical protein